MPLPSSSIFPTPLALQEPVAGMHGSVHICARMLYCTQLDVGVSSLQVLQAGGLQS